MFPCTTEGGASAGRRKVLLGRQTAGMHIPGMCCPQGDLRLCSALRLAKGIELPDVHTPFFVYTRQSHSLLRISRSYFMRVYSLAQWTRSLDAHPRSHSRASALALAAVRKVLAMKLTTLPFSGILSWRRGPVGVFAVTHTPHPRCVCCHTHTPPLHHWLVQRYRGLPLCLKARLPEIPSLPSSLQAPDAS